MAGFNIHLAIGKKYIENNNNIKDINEFYNGVVAPDLAPDKVISHYTSCTDKSNLEYYLSKRIELYDYLIHNKINNDYDKGVFIHLITDYLFFNHFFEKKYINSIDINKFNNDLYHSYDNTDKYLEDKYELKEITIYNDLIEYKNKSKKQKKTTYENGKDILPLDKLEEFINKTSIINIDNYKNKILKCKKNVLPQFDNIYY